jgi:chorismate dehydratase
MGALRVSAISFLNTAPLMWDFEHDPSAELRENFSVQYTVPSQCAEALRAGEADLGIIPVITAARIANLVILPDVAIASRGPVKSILLAGRRPIEEIRTVAVDTSSRSSVGLLEILLTRFFGGRRELRPMPPELPEMLAACDAALVIGDAALVARTDGLYAYDLGELWREKTGLPFVYAVWAARRAALETMPPDLPLGEIFRRSRDRGLEAQNLSAIGREWAPRLGMSEEAIVAYLRKNIHYALDEECRRGLQLYFQLAAECGVIERAPELELWTGA